MRRVDPASCLHTCLVWLLRSRKEPGQKINRCDCHANAEDNPGKHPLVSTFTKSEHQAANHDGDKAEALGNRAGKSSLELLDGVLPRASPGLEQNECEHHVHMHIPETRMFAARIHTQTRQS